ncbi:MAG: hypothetical protein ACE5FG_12205 [Myxococcota bacterium]
MSLYLPRSRAIIVHCLVRSHWVSGRLLLPTNRSLLDYLNARGSFLKLLDVVFPTGSRRTASFFLLRRDAISFIVPETGEDGIVQSVPEPHHSEGAVSCLFPFAEIEGRMSVREGVRVSGEITRVRGFFPLKDAHIRLESEAATLPIPEHVPLVLLHVGTLVGVADLGSSEEDEKDAG